MNSQGKLHGVQSPGCGLHLILEQAWLSQTKDGL